MFITESIYWRINRRAESLVLQGRTALEVITIIARETGKTEEETVWNLMPAFVRLNRRGSVNRADFPADYNWQEGR